MILPTKHLNEARSLLRIGAEILLLTRKETTVSRLWADFQKYRLEELEIKPVTYDWFILALDLLFILGIIEFSEGKITRSQHDTQSLQFPKNLQRA